MDVIQKLVDLGKQAIAEKDWWKRVILVLEMIAIASKAGIDLSKLFGPRGELALLAAGPRPETVAAAAPATSAASAAVAELEAKAQAESVRAEATSAPGTVGGFLPPIETLVVRAIFEIIRLLL